MIHTQNSFIETNLSTAEISLLLRIVIFQEIPFPAGIFLIKKNEEVLPYFKCFRVFVIETNNGFSFLDCQGGGAHAESTVYPGMSSVRVLAGWQDHQVRCYGIEMILDSVNVLVRIEISLLRYTEKGDSVG